MLSLSLLSVLFFFLFLIINVSVNKKVKASAGIEPTTFPLLGERTADYAKRPYRLYYSSIPFILSSFSSFTFFYPSSLPFLLFFNCRFFNCRTFPFYKFYHRYRIVYSFMWVTVLANPFNFITVFIIIVALP